HELVHGPLHHSIVSFRFVDAGRAAGLLRWLEGEPADVADLAAQVAVTAVQRHGTTVCYGDHARRRRLLAFDRHEPLLAALRGHGAERDRGARRRPGPERAPLQRAVPDGAALHHAPGVVPL